MAEHASTSYAAVVAGTEVPPAVASTRKGSEAQSSVIPAPFPAPKTKIPRIKRADLESLQEENRRLKEEVARRAEQPMDTTPAANEQPLASMEQPMAPAQQPMAPPEQPLAATEQPLANAPETARAQAQMPTPVAPTMPGQWQPSPRNPVTSGGAQGGDHSVRGGRTRRGTRGARSARPQGMHSGSVQHPRNVQPMPWHPMLPHLRDQLRTLTQMADAMCRRQ